MKPYSIKRFAKTPLRGQRTPIAEQRTPVGGSKGGGGGRVGECMNCGRICRPGPTGTCSWACRNIKAQADADLEKSLRFFDKALKYEHTITSGRDYSPEYLIGIGRVRSTRQGALYFDALELTERAVYVQQRDRWRVK